MNDKDFDDIGKRLHDLEADPPKSGWDKIATTLSSLKQPGKVVWLRKHWWKPLVILIPVSVYLIYSGQRTTELASSLSSAKNITIANDSVNINLTSKETIDANIIEEKSIEKSPALTTRTDIDTNISASVARSVTKRVNEKSESEIYRPADINSSPVVKVNTLVSKPVDENNLLGVLENGSVKIVEEPIDASENDQDGQVVVLAQTPEDINKKITNTQSINEDIVVSGEEEIIPNDSSSNKTIEKERQKSQWRLSALVSPQYLTKTVKPVTNDEVLVTDIEANKLERMGFGFGIGAGRAITPELYVDGQLSYVESSQVVNYSYATGKVDTLIATQQADQSVLVSPVYQIGSRQISTRYGYGGVRLGATYYFGTAPRGRFNLAASAGAHFLLSSQVKEYINDTWVSLSNKNLNKVNYSFMVGAGYCINLNKGWELMINPALTYYLKEIQNEGLPYKLNKQALGLNFMLSKTLGLR